MTLPNKSTAEKTVEIPHKKRYDEPMRSKRRTIFTILSVILFLFSLAVVFFFRNWLLVNPFEPYELTEVITACKDRDGNLYVVDQTGERLLKTDPDGNLLWQKKASDSNFVKAVRICTDDKGNVYVQDKRIESGIRLKREAVLQYSPDGTLLNTVFRKEADQGQIRPSLVGLFADDGGASVVLSQKDGIVINSLISGKTQFFPMDQADDLVLNAVWDSTSDALWYCTFNGRICRYVDGENDLLLYDNSQHVEEDESVPRAISTLDGTIYAADRGLRCLVAIDEETGEAAFLHEDAPWTEREVCDSVNSDYSLVSTTGSVVKVWENDQCEDIQEVLLSTKYKLVVWLLWGSLTVLAVCAAVCLVFLIFFLLKKASTMARIIAAILVGVGALAAMLVGTLFPNFNTQLLESKYDKAEFCAALTLQRMDVNAFLNLDESSDYLGEDYRSVQETVNSVFKTNSSSADDLYCTMYRVRGDYDTITLTYSMDENSMLFPYDWEYEDSEEQAILTSGKGRQYINRSVEGSYLFVLDPILDKDGTPVGLIEVGTDLQSFERENQKLFIDLLLNLIAITAVAVMLLVEVVYFVRGRREYVKHAKDSAGKVVIPAGLLRMIVFLIFFFTNLTTAVLPTYAIRLASAAKIPGISKEFLSAVPFSAEVIAGALFSILGADLIRKLSLKRSALLCSILFSAGLALRIIPSFWMITLGSLVIGIGWGVVLLIVNILIANMPGEKKDTGFAYYNAAALNGVNSGTVFGGFLLNWIPYTALFALTAGGSICLFLIVRAYLIHARPEESEEEESSQKQGHLSFLSFLLKPNILIFFLMLVVPVLTGSYFLIYMFPIIGTRWGLTDTYVGYSYLLNGLCVMALTTTMTNLFTRTRQKRFGLTMSALLYALSFSIVAIFQSIPALLVSLVILGFSDSFGLPLQTSFYTDQKEVKSFGIDRSLGVYSLFENASQALGPFVFSWALVVGVSKGLFAISVVIAVLAVVFLFAGLFRKKQL